jgi:hypothetical protein
MSFGSWLTMKSEIAGIQSVKKYIAPKPSALIENRMVRKRTIQLLKIPFTDPTFFLPHMS